MRSIWSAHCGLSYRNKHRQERTDEDTGSDLRHRCYVDVPWTYDVWYFQLLHSATLCLFDPAMRLRVLDWRTHPKHL